MRVFGAAERREEGRSPGLGVLAGPGWFRNSRAGDRVRGCDEAPSCRYGTVLALCSNTSRMTCSSPL